MIKAELDLLQKLREFCCCKITEHKNCEQLSLDYDEDSQENKPNSNVNDKM